MIHFSKHEESRDGLDTALSASAPQCGIACDAEVTSKSGVQSLKQIRIIGVDLAKNVFQLHSAAADRTVLFRKNLSRLQFGRSMADYPAREVKIEARLSAH